MRLPSLGITWLLWPTLPLFVVGCLRDLDVSKITCRNNEGCPVGYACNLVTSHCCRSGNGLACDQHDDAAVAEIGGATDDSGSVEVSRVSDGPLRDLSGPTSEVGDVLDVPAVQKDDASPDVAATGGRSGSGGEAGSGTGHSSGGQAGAATGGRGGQAGVATGGGSGTGTGGSPTAGGGSSGTGGASGAGGGIAPVCQNADQRCSGNSVETCIAGQWVRATACGTRQTCTQSAGLAECVCKTDPVCSALGNTCADSSTVVSCSRDQDGCFYESTSSVCTAGSCSVAGAAALCCTCTTDGPQCASGGTTQTCASSLVCARTTPTVCADANWAQWPMPNGPTDVSNGAPHAASYTDNGDGTVSDNVTGLIWQRVSSGPYTWSQAMAHCSPLVLGGQKGWRLPTRIELLSLVDYSVVGSSTTPMINTTFFPTTLSAYYWTSTASAGTQSSEAWIVNFAQGGGGSISMAITTGYALCVR